MPINLRDDGTPIVYFDTTIEVSPFTLFRRLQRGQPLLLVDVRPRTGDRTLRGAVREPHPDWVPEDMRMEVVLFDDDGSLAVAKAQRLREAGFLRARALFGGLDLYEFSLDPEVVESDTFLVGKT